MSRLFTKNELIELYQILKRERMLPVAKIALINIPLRPGSKAYESKLFFINLDKTLPTTIVSRLPIHEVNATRQLRKYFSA